MTGRIYILIGLTMYPALCQTFRFAVKGLYKPYGPKMCKELQRHLIDFYIFNQTDLSCRRFPPACPITEHLNPDGSAAPELFLHSSDFNGIVSTSHQPQIAENISIVVKCKPHINLLQACVKGKLEDVKNILYQRLEDINCRGFKGRTPVMVAALKGQEAVFDFLVSQCCDLSAVDYNNDTVLHLACKNGQTAIVRKLTDDEKLDVDNRGSKGRTPVIIAAVHGFKATFDFLISRGCDLTSTVRSLNFLHWACIGGNVDIVNSVLSKDIFDIESRGALDYTPLMFAIRYGHVKVIELLLSRSCEVTLLNVHKHNILHFSCVFGNLDVLKYVLSRNLVDLESTDINGRTPVLVAAKSGHVSVVQLLADSGCILTVVDKRKNNILHTACLSNRVDMVKYILSNNMVDIDSRCEYDRTPVLISARNGYLNLTKLLIGKGCDVTLVDWTGNNILFSAIIRRQTDVVKYILKLGMLLEVKDRLGSTPIMTAVSIGSVEIVDLLKRKGCNLRVTMNRNNLLHEACVSGKVSMVKYILAQGINDIERQGSRDETPLLKAAEKGNIEVVKLLVNQGCNMRARDIMGNTISHLACRKGHLPLVKYLIKMGMMKESEVNKEGKTPLQLAKSVGHKRIVALLKGRARSNETDMKNVRHGVRHNI